VYQFERECEATFNVRHCLALNSCTSGLLAGLSALGIGPGDEVIVPGYTFIASIAAVIYARAVPVLAEIDESLTLDPRDVEAKVGPKTKAILAVHMLGSPCNLDELASIARRHNLFLIEDVAQACGASYKGKALGSIGDCGAFSLNVFKTITAGDGGMLTTNSTPLYERAFAFHDHGAKPFRQGVLDDGSLLGLNLRMNELVGAVALAQIRKLPGIVTALRHKKRVFKELLTQLGGLKFRVEHDPDGDCATVLALLFDSRQQAEALAEALGSKTLLQSGKHYYGNMIQLLNQNMPTAAGCPFQCSHFPTDVTYAKGMLPRTDDILSRAVCLSVGVSDSYLGTDFGITVLDDDDAIRQKANEFALRTARFRPQLSSGE
jgi:dTDP-4-amino-4,6-dideoxygalactose transaminase